jgi:TPR repeat protein
MPPATKRLASDTAATSKKFRSAIDDSVAEFICPITQELPLDPVTAEDGHVYERESIEQWLEQKQTSPVTNLGMGKALFPAVQVRCVIHKLVLSGAISGDKADKWQQRIKEEEEFKKIKEKAEQGDAASMTTLGNFYFSWDFSSKASKDRNKAYQWYWCGAKHGEVRALTRLGQMRHCVVIDDNLYTTCSLVFTTEAATRGDAKACVQLARILARDNCKVSHKTGWNQELKQEMTKRWYEKALKCTNAMGGIAPDEDDKEEANKWLRKNASVASTWKL